MSCKSILSRIKSRLFRIYGERFQPYLTCLASKRPIFSRFYYAWINSSFSLEQYAVAAGINRYHKSCGQDKGTNYLLRRNIHRIEKGLLMRPRRELFALSYIKETVDSFCVSLSSFGENDEVKWAGSVLNVYFDTVTAHPVIDGERERFRAVWSSDTKEQQPYVRSGADLKMDYAGLLELMSSRKSVRWFQNKSVPRTFIDQAVKAAALSPSACNRQPFDFRIFDEPELVRQVADIPMGTQGYADNIPVIAVVTGHLHAYFSERDRHLIYIDSSLAAMSFMLALEAQGVGSCCINWPDMPDKQRRLFSLLKLKKYERPVMLIALGYRDKNGLVAYSRRKTLDELRSYNNK